MVKSLKCKDRIVPNCKVFTSMVSNPSLKCLFSFDAWRCWTQLWICCIMASSFHASTQASANQIAAARGQCSPVKFVHKGGYVSKNLAFLCTKGEKIWKNVNRYDNGISKGQPKKSGMLIVKCWPNIPVLSTQLKVSLVQLCAKKHAGVVQCGRSK